MSIKPVWIVLASDTDLAEVVRAHPEMSEAIEGLHAEDNGDVRVDITTTDPPQTLLIMHGSDGDPDRVGWEPDEVAKLTALGVYKHPSSIEARSPELTARLVSMFAERARIAVDNDWDRIVSGDDFLGMDEAGQVSFIMAARDAYAAEKRATAAE